MSELKKFGRELREVLNQGDVFEILDEGDWGAGGCWILAEALVEYLGPPAKLLAVSSSKLPVEHFVVEYIDLYIDYNGAQDKAELMKNLKADGIKSPRLVKVTPRLKDDALDLGIPCDYGKVRQLISKLNSYFAR